ncbi:MAG: DUF1902 domain-containing protein [Proteobacteria bacterium]|nr:DUF1902 domain-containing protein [Pseudomonadota bacterium]MBU4471233.1 DUF1902 domain-containing protein [Pseudomonadota bacterium]
MVNGCELRHFHPKLLKIDVPGLATEEEPLEGLIQKLKVMIPELLEPNGAKTNKDLPFDC